MKPFVTACLAAAAITTAAQAQVVLRFLGSLDGGNTWSSNVDINPGSHVDVIATVSYTGSTTGITGFCAANFQPIISGWNYAGAVDHISTISNGGNTIGGMIQPQASSSGLGTPNPYLSPTPGTSGSGSTVPAGPYVPNTYGRVFPMGRTPQTGATSLTSFMHVNPPPDQLGRTYAPGTYVRIAQSNNPDWFNAATNNNGSGGVNASQLYIGGRTTSDPDFWGARDAAYDPGDPVNGIPESWSPTTNGHVERLRNVQLFRFGIDIGYYPGGRFMLVDAPLAGMMMNVAGTDRAISFYPEHATGTTGTEYTFGSGQLTVQPLGIQDPVPAPASVSLVSATLLFATRRRRARH